MKYILFTILTEIARLIIKIKRPYIIGVTATVGKTTMTYFIASFLEKAFSREDVYRSPYSYNGEYGIPLAILGVKNPEKNIFLWVYIYIKGVLRLVLPYPKYLILEYGVDHPGEMDFLLSIAVPEIAIIGPISPNHIEQFGDFDTYRQEKLKLASQCNIVIAYGELRDHISSEAVFYSLGAMSDIDASHIKQYEDHLEAIVHVRKADYNITAPIFGTYQLLNILPLFEIANILGIKVNLLLDAIRDFSLESGRSTILRGKWNAIIIDGSYNGGYFSIVEGLRTLITFSDENRIILILGDMRELGNMTESLHRSLALFIKEHLAGRSDVRVVLVGNLMKRYVAEELENIFPVFQTGSSREAGIYVSRILEADPKKTLVYVKGSQNTIFLEEAVEKILHDHKDAVYLCRNSKHWKIKKEKFFQEMSCSGEKS